MVVLRASDAQAAEDTSVSGMIGVIQVPSPGLSASISHAWIPKAQRPDAV